MPFWRSGRRTFTGGSGLPFGPRSRYFSGLVMKERRRTSSAWWVGVALLLTACSERERLTFPDPGDGKGPQTKIERPSQDTVVRAGPGVIVSGRSIDPDGLDTVYFELAGSAETFPPFLAASDTVHFGIPLDTRGLAGRKITVLIFGTDKLGNRGDTAYRVLDVR